MVRLGVNATGPLALGPRPSVLCGDEELLEDSESGQRWVWAWGEMEQGHPMAVSRCSRPLKAGSASRI